MTAETTFTREMRPLTRIRDNYEKIILTAYRLTLGNYNGIQVKTRSIGYREKMRKIQTEKRCRNWCNNQNLQPPHKPNRPSLLRKSGFKILFQYSFTGAPPQTVHR